MFGKFRRAIEAAQYDVDAAVAARNVVLVSLVADVIRAYLDLRALQMQLAVLRKDIEVAQKYVDFVQERFNRGITNELDVTSGPTRNGAIAGASRAADRADQCGALRDRRADRRISRKSRQRADKAGNASGPAGAHSRRLADRPAAPPARHCRSRTPIGERHRADRRRHRRSVSPSGRNRVRADCAGTGVSPLPISPIWSVGPAVAAPLLDFGRLDAVVEKADFRSRELLFDYKQTVLNAVREVDTAVDAYAAQQERLRHLADALTAARRAVTLATERFDRGLTNSLNVIDAQRQEYDIEQQYVAAQQNAAEQFVTLYKSLGGGWEDYQVFPPIPRPMPAVAAAFKRLIDRSTAP